MALPLDGVTVLDPTHAIAGPFCTKMLALFGAEVIKVEKPGRGDISRTMGPFPGDLPDGEKSGTFLQLNVSKKSVTLDLSTATGAAIFRELAKRSDIVLENFRPGVMAGFGLSYEALSEVNPRLVTTSISNFGQDGPYRDYEGENLIVWALSGLMSVTGDPDKPPLKTGGYQSDYMAGLNGLVMTLLAFVQSQNEGQGVYVDLSAHESVVANVEYLITMYTFLGATRGRWYSRHPFSYPNEIMPCKDGHVAVIPGTSGGFASLALMLGRPELMEDELFTSLRARIERSEELEDLISPFLMEHERDEVVQLAQELRMPFAAVRGANEILEDPQLAARGFITEVEHPQAGVLPYIKAPFILGDTSGSLRRPPLLGEHNEEILCGRLGYSKQDLGRLRARGVI